MARVNTVILNWNAADDTGRCLRQVEGWSGVDSRTWVVDNGSQGPDLQLLERGLGGASLLRSDQNLGFSGGTNLGVARAVETSDAPVLLLNNDVTMTGDAVSTLLETLASRPECGIVGPVLLQPDGDGSRILSAGSRNPVLHRFPAITAPPEGGKSYRAAYVSGAAVLIRAEVFRRVGLFDERYFFATEMADLCRRAEQSGFTTLVNPRSTALHDVERASSLRETLYVYYVVRNRFLYIGKFHRLLSPLLIGFWGLYGFEQAWRLKRQGRGATAAAIRMGVVHGLTRRFGGRNEEVIARCGRGGTGGVVS